MSGVWLISCLPSRWDVRRLDRTGPPPPLLEPLSEEQAAVSTEADSGETTSGLLLLQSPGSGGFSVLDHSQSPLLSSSDLARVLSSLAKRTELINNDKTNIEQCQHSKNIHLVIGLFDKSLDCF